MMRSGSQIRLGSSVKMPTTNNGYGWKLVFALLNITEANKMYTSPEHTFHRSDLAPWLQRKNHILVLSNRIKNIAPKLTTQRCRLEYFYKEMMKIKRWNLPNTKPNTKNIFGINLLSWHASGHAFSICIHITEAISNVVVSSSSRS
jgi:hypothetical protein